MASDILFWLGILVAGVLAIATAVRNLLIWRRSGFRTPAYVHVLAVVALGLAAFIGYGRYQDEGRIGPEVALLLVLPAVVYWAYVAGGGPTEQRAAEARERDPNGVRAGAGHDPDARAARGGPSPAAAGQPGSRPARSQQRTWEA